MTKLSPQQQEVLRWAEQDKGSLNLIARAGCGKTFTLLELVKFIADRNLGEVFLGAYNKAIAVELQEKLKKANIDWKKANAGTLHSVGYGAWRRVAKDVQINAKKTEDILNTMLEAAGPYTDKAMKIQAYGSFVRKAVSLAKQAAFGLLVSVDDREAWYEMVDHYGLDEELPEEGTYGIEPAIDLCVEVMQVGFKMDTQVIDFDDMILAPLIHKARIWPKDWVLIDEAQDTNAARRALAMAMLKPRTGRLVAVGDPHQAIYGFTGANHDSMDIIKKQLGSKELPLNKTYRCPKTIVKVANQWVPDIEAQPEAPVGVYRDSPLYPEDGKPGFFDEGLKAGDAILCRNTKPLVEMAYSLIKRKIGCYVEGKEIGSGLLKLAGRWKVKTLPALEKKLEQYRERETQKWLAKGREEMAAGVNDRIDTVKCIIQQLYSEKKNSAEDLIQAIRNLFKDTEDGKKPEVVLLSTVHKSKGREWDRVYLLERDKYMPSRWARKDWQLQQENNLLYVAVTRAKRELIEVF